MTSQPAGQSAEDEPLPFSGQRPPVVVGTLMWAVLFVLAWVRHGRLEADGHGWWMWTCLAGIVLGILGYSYLQRIYTRERHREDG